MKLTEVRQQGRPIDVRKQPVTVGGGIAGITGTTRTILYFGGIDVDGGNLGDAADGLVAASIGNFNDGMTEAMDYMETNLDGGTI